MTEGDGRGQEAWAPVLRDVARASGHELRNALNALAVNLEVVRNRTPENESAAPFIRQAVEQSEESARLAEGMIALLNLLVAAIGDGGLPRIQGSGPRGARIESTDGEAQRAVRALEGLGARTGLRAETRDAAVILSICDSSTEPPETE